MTPVVLLAAVLVLVGLVGVVVPLLPGPSLVLLGVLLWAADTGTAAAWLVFVASCLLVAAGAVAKYLLPGRRLRDAGVPTATLAVGGALGILGFFVLPVVGLVLGFVLGVYLAEWHRLDRRQAWPATVAAMKAVGLGIVIELGAALLATAAWVAGLALAG
ncbi:MAG TPA: DUF456 domain-containing protein [Marmoricola sp.]|nr:DUF456 domain-containing protein [Marmoricola sp.]